MVKTLALTAALTFIPAQYINAIPEVPDIVEEVTPGWPVSCEGIDQLLVDVGGVKGEYLKMVDKLYTLIDTGQVDAEHIESAANQFNILLFLTHELEYLENNLVRFNVINCQSL